MSKTKHNRTVAKYLEVENEIRDLEEKLETSIRDARNCIRTGKDFNGKLLTEEGIIQALEFISVNEQSLQILRDRPYSIENLRAQSMGENENENKN